MSELSTSDAINCGLYKLLFAIEDIERLAPYMEQAHRDEVACYAEALENGASKLRRVERQMRVVG